MSQILPQFVCDPEGMLHFAELHTTSPRTEEHLEALETYPGVYATENAGSITITANVDDAFGASFSDNYNFADEERLIALLTHISRLLPVYPKDKIDRIVGLEFIGPHGSIGVIYPQFQRWLNESGITESSALNCLLAMAKPFGERRLKETRKRFSYMGNHADGSPLRISTRSTEFSLYATEEQDDQLVERQGRIRWQDLDLSMLGSCACWGSSGDRREVFFSHYPRLYEMSPHNVDIARQSLSLIMGLGVLAYEAASYQGEEDIFTQAEWTSERSFTKDSTRAELIRRVHRPKK